VSGSGRTLVLVWAFSGLGLLPAFDSPQVSRTALVLLPWLVWAGWPAADSSDPQGAGAGWIRRIFPALALAAPMLALASELDRASGWAPSDPLHTAAMGLALWGIYGAARAEFARAGGRAARVYGAFWLVVVLLVPLLVAVVQLGGAAPPSWAGMAVAGSPAGWCIGRLASDSTLAPGALPDGAPSLALALAAWGAAVALRRGGRA
jgi:hypothetical protein